MMTRVVGVVMTMATTTRVIVNVMMVIVTVTMVVSMIVVMIAVMMAMVTMNGADVIGWLAAVISFRFHC